MKNVCMALFFFFGLAITQLSAQSCTPSPNCPPACCAKAGKAEGKSAAVDGKATGVALTASCTPAQLEACKSAEAKSCCAKSGKSAALTTTGKATTVSNKSTDADSKKACTQPCAKVASTMEQ